MNEQIRRLYKQADEINKQLEAKGVQTRASVNERMLRIEYRDPPKKERPDSTLD
jgi:hypothetical protein